MVQLKRNPNYWMTDPVGPGQGNQLPYIDTIKYLIIQDPSTRLAAIRTAGIDEIGALNAEDKDQVAGTASDLMVAARGTWQTPSLYMRTDKAPFNDINVRKALIMATDFNTINDSLYEGQADIVSWPYFFVEGYNPLHVGLDDADCPQEVKDMYTYNPDMAKQLLTDAGYPNGFKTDLVLLQTDVDYYSILADMWSQIGVELNLDVTADVGALMGIANSIGYQDMIAIGTSPPSSYPEQSLYAARNWVNCSLINEEYVDQEAAKIRAQAVTDFQAAMEMTRPLVIYLLGKAYVVPAPRYPTYTVWWPWLKNYSGETSVGYFPGDSWTQWVWVDQNMKSTMGH
jgi:peptide/nickel transport system substrate-binding protein